MRVVVSVGLVLIALAASALIVAQNRNETIGKEKKEPAKVEPQPIAGGEREKGGAGPGPLQEKKATPEKSPTSLTSRAILSRLQLEVDTQDFKQRMKFKDFLADITQHMQARDQAVTILVDVEAFIQINGPDSPHPFDEEVVFNSNRKGATVIDMLNQVVKQIGKGSAFIIRDGRVDIVPLAHTAKEYMLNQTVRVDFKEQRLDLALEEISDLTGVSIILDARAKEKAKTSVTARFSDDVAMQDAVRMLTDMAELKIVYLVTGMYITTPENAKVMQKELKDLYEPKAPGVPFIGPGGVPFDPSMLGGPLPDPSLSPLAPPLPPPSLRGGKRLEAAA
jgi:hypothetical protein